MDGGLVPPQPPGGPVAPQLLWLWCCTLAYWAGRRIAVRISGGVLPSFHAQPLVAHFWAGLLGGPPPDPGAPPFLFPSVLAPPILPDPAG